MGINNTLNALQGKLPVVVSFCVFLSELVFLPTDRVTVPGVQFLKHKHTHTYKHKQELPNTFHFAHIT